MVCPINTRLSRSISNPEFNRGFGEINILAPHISSPSHECHGAAPGSHAFQDEISFDKEASRRIRGLDIIGGGDVTPDRFRVFHRVC